MRGEAHAREPKNDSVIIVGGGRQRPPSNAPRMKPALAQLWGAHLKFAWHCIRRNAGLLGTAMEKKWRKKAREELELFGSPTPCRLTSRFFQLAWSACPPRRLLDLCFAGCGHLDYPRENKYEM